MLLLELHMLANEELLPSKAFLEPALDMADRFAAGAVSCLDARVACRTSRVFVRVCSSSLSTDFALALIC